MNFNQQSLLPIASMLICNYRKFSRLLNGALVNGFTCVRGDFLPSWLGAAKWGTRPNLALLKRTGGEVSFLT